MCLAIALRLISVDGKHAVGEAGGVQRPIRVDFIRNPQVGEYVIVHAGFAIERLDPEQAALNQAAWQEVQDALQ
jgi:hydrogenase expression/formation protein HypC